MCLVEVFKWLRVVFEHDVLSPWFDSYFRHHAVWSAVPFLSLQGTYFETYLHQNIDHIPCTH